MTEYSDKRSLAIRAIQQFYEQGTRAPRKGQDYGKEAIKDEASRLGINQDTLRKARAFADPMQGYSRTELDALIRQLRSLDDGETKWIFGKTHIIRLLTVAKEGGEREAVQQEVIDSKLSCSQLDEILRQRYGSRRKGGRPRRVAKDRSGLLAQAQLECDRWERWWRSLNTESDGEKPVEHFPAALRKDLKQIILSIQRLREKVEAAQKRRATGE